MGGKIGANAYLCQPVLDRQLVMVGHSQDKPLRRLFLMAIAFSNERGALYRHPGLVLTGGRAKDKLRIGRVIAAFSAVYIRQRFHRSS